MNPSLVPVIPSPCCRRWHGPFISGPALLSPDFCPLPFLQSAPDAQLPWKRARERLNGVLWPLCETAPQSFFKDCICQVLSVILPQHCQTYRMHFAGEQKHWMELEAQWLIHFIHYLNLGEGRGIQDFAQRGLKGLQQAPSVWAARPARTGSPWFEREVTHFSWFSDSPCASSVHQVQSELVIHSHPLLSRDLPSASRKSRDFPWQSTSKIHLLLTRGGGDHQTHTTYSSSPPDIWEKIQHLGAFTLHQPNINLVQCGIWTGEIVVILTDWIKTKKAEGSYTSSRETHLPLNKNSLFWAWQRWAAESASGSCLRWHPASHEDPRVGGKRFRVLLEKESLMFSANLKPLPASFLHVYGFGPHPCLIGQEVRGPVDRHRQGSWSWDPLEGSVQGVGNEKPVGLRVCYLVALNLWQITWLLSLNFLIYKMELIVVTLQKTWINTS